MKKNFHIVVISFLFSVVLWIWISLSNDFYTTFNVPLKLIDFKKGLTSSSKLPRYVSVKVKAKGWKLIAARLGTESEFLVTASGDTGSKYINLYNYLSENQWLSSEMDVIDISPDTLSFNIQKVTHKKLKVEPDVEINFREGYGLATPIAVSPDSVIVNGPVNELQKMNSIPTSKIKLEDVNDKIEKRIELKKIPGITYLENSVALFFDIQKIVDMTIDNVNVNVLDVPKDRDVVLLPNKIAISVKGGVDILGKLTNDQFKAYVNYRDVVLDTLGAVIPKIEAPENVTVQYIKPEQLRYVIKKFN